MSFKTNNYGTRCLPGGCSFKTIEELNELLTRKDLTTEDLNLLRQLRANFHHFRCSSDFINSVSSMHNNEPSAVIFLDIKGTLYSGGTHFMGRGILARSPLDSEPIQYDDIKAFGEMISRTKPQDFRLDYNFNNNYELQPTKRAYSESLVKRKPSILEKRPLFARPSHLTKYGPFTVVFISSDTVETQKNIVSLLYYMALFEEKKFALKNGYLFGLDSLTSAMLSTEESIIDIENRLLKYDNDFMRFLEYENKNFARLSYEEIVEFKETIDGLFFRSTSETGKTKEQLMEEFLEASVIRARVGRDYSTFALGDNYYQDGGMLSRAFLADGFGLMLERNSYNGSCELIEALAKKGINLSYLPTVGSFSQFYTMVMTTLLVKRENELIEAMICANHNVDNYYAFKTSNVEVCLTKKLSKLEVNPK